MRLMDLLLICFFDFGFDGRSTTFIVEGGGLGDFAWSLNK